jgi:hypothetical protein
MFKGIASRKRRMTMLGSISCGGLAGIVFKGIVK